MNALGGCTILGTGDPATVYDGTAGHPNIFQGMVAGPNSLIWPNIPLDPAGPDNQNTLILRFVNLRVDAAGLGMVSLGQPPVSVEVTLTTSGAMPARVLNNPQQIIGQAQGGFVPSANTPIQCAPEAATLSGVLGKQISQVDLVAAKGFAASFKPRTFTFVDENTSPPPAVQDIPGRIYFPLPEIAFFNSAYPTLPGHGNLGQAGLADQGTRVAVRISNVAPGVTLYSPLVIAEPIICTFLGLGPVARRVTTNANGSGPFTPTAGDSAGLASLVEQGGALTAVYEVLSTCPFTLTDGNLDIPIFADAPSLGDATAIVALAPFGVEPKTTGLGPPPPPGNPPIPRFVLPTGPGLALTPLVCQP